MLRLVRNRSSHQRCSVRKAVLRDCSYGGELARLAGLARLSVHMRSEPARLDGISLDFVGIPPRCDENFPYEHAQVGQPDKVG